MAATIAIVSAASVLALAGTPLFLPAIAVGVVLIGSSLLVLFYRPDEAALFLIAQPAVFLSWSVSPVFSAALESLVTLAFLASTGVSWKRNGIVSTILLVLLPICLALVVSGHRHVLIPLVLVLATSGIVTLVILGLASHLISSALGGLHHTISRR
jgi:hypothetical protein